MHSLCSSCFPGASSHIDYVLLILQGEKTRHGLVAISWNSSS